MVVSLIIMLAGFTSMINLPVAQYPDLTPPTIQVEAQYPGCSAEVLSETVASVLEDKINGVEDMIYMNSVSSSNGFLTITVSFKVGTDPDMALINVNNRVQMATASLPEEVRRYGVTVNKESPSILQVGAFYSKSDMYDETFLGNYAIQNIAEHLKRIEGVGDAEVMTNNSYSIRIWLKPDKLYKYGLTTKDVYNAIVEQNSQRAAGDVGKAPMTNIKVDKSYSIIVQGRYKTEEEFKEIIIRANKNGDCLKVCDVADVELGAQTYEVTTETDGAKSVPILITLSPGANAINTVDAVNSKIVELSDKFPEGTAYKVTYDTTNFVKHSIKEVVNTLFEAIVLVFLIVLLFLKRFKTTLIPCLAVPVSIIGAFAGMMLLGFSINTLTLFGLVLAIGIVVDDAIIVIENVERLMHSEKLNVRDATLKAMQEVSGPVVAIVLVLCSVFVPIGFTGGFTGIMYKQFAITIAISVLISGFVALTLTPSLCVLLISDDGQYKNKFFDWFDVKFAKFTDLYVKAIAFFTKNIMVSVIAIAGILGSMYGMYKIVPTSFLPEEDQGIALVSGVLDPSASISRSEKIAKSVERIARNNKATYDTMVIAGYDLLSGALKSNSVTMFMRLKDWSERKSDDMSSFSVVKDIMKGGFALTDALIIGFTPPPIMGLSTTGGFEGYLQKLGDSNPRELEEKIREVVQKASLRPELSGVRSTFNASVPQIKVSVNNIKAMSMGVSIADIYNTMGMTFGAAYVNDFSKLGKNFKVMMQARDRYRAYPEQFNEIYVRSMTTGAMVPVASLIDVEQIVGADTIERFNNYPAAKIIGNPAKGYTSGQAIQAMEEVCKEVCGNDYAMSWSGQAYQEKAIGSSSSYVLLLGILVVFLILAAQYENWSIPIAVLLAIPFAAFGALLAVVMRNYSNDLYFQIALVTLVGLSTKNAILIVEFAMILYKEQKMNLFDAAIKAAKLRFRPIIMTSLAFILGCLPLALSSGAGSASRHSLGTSIVGGMLASTFIAPLFIPMFFILVMKFSEKIKRSKNDNEKNN